MSTLERNIAESIASADDVRWFRGYLQGVLDAGDTTAAELQRILRAVYEESRMSGEDEVADLVLDGLDFLTGWHGPNLGIAARGNP
jgi:hypothetical protein